MAVELPGHFVNAITHPLLMGEMGVLGTRQEVTCPAMKITVQVQKSVTLAISKMLMHVLNSNLISF